MALTTLADVRELVEKHLPTEHAQNIRGATSELCLLALLAERMTRPTSRLRCTWCWRWKASNAARGRVPPLPAALDRRRP